MTDVKSKNLYELLGNDSDQDSDREPSPLPQVADKPTARSGKRDTPKEAPTEPQGEQRAARGGRGGRGGDLTGSEGAFQDRGAGRQSNRGKPVGTEDGDRLGHNFDRGGRGSRGSRGPRRGGDKQSRTGQTEHTKQADQSWGAPTGESELADEKAGDAIAKEEVNEGGWDANNSSAPGWTDSSGPTESKAGGWDSGEGATGFKDAGAPAEGETVPTEPAEPEDTHKSYADYMAEQATKKMKELGVLEPRQANEGSKQDNKWANAKEITKGTDEEQYFQGAEGKAKRERDRLRNAKEKLDVDFRYQEQPRGGSERARGRGRGDRGERGEFRGRGRGRGDFGDRGDREGSFRGGRGDGHRGRGDRGEYRGRGRGRGGREGANGTGVPVPVDDEAAFPTLGSKK